MEEVGVPQGEGVEVLQVEEVEVPHRQCKTRVAAEVEVGKRLQQHTHSLYEKLQRKKTQKSTKW